MADTKQSNEYQEQSVHTVTKGNCKTGEGILKSRPAICMDAVYKKKKVRIHLLFTESQNHKNAQHFYDELKKIYLEKTRSGAMQS